MVGIFFFRLDCEYAWKVQNNAWDIVTHNKYLWNTWHFKNMHFYIFILMYVKRENTRNKIYVKTEPKDVAPKL